MKRAYSPRKGSAVSAAIEHMRQHAAGKVFTAADFAQLGDFGPHWSTYLVPALKHHLIERAIGPNGLSTGYRLTARDPFDADELRGGKPLQVRSDAREAAPIGAVGPSSVFALADEPAPPPSGFKRWLANRKEDSAEGSSRRKRTPAVRATPTTEIIEVTKARPLCCALFNTGELLVEIPGAASLRLDPLQVADLVRYLKRVHPEFGVPA